MRAYCRELARRSQARKVARSQPAGGRKAARSSAGREPARPGGWRRGGESRRGKPAAETPISRGPSGDDRSPFLPIQVATGDFAADAAGVEIHLGHGRMICVRPGFDPRTVCEVLAALEGRPC